MPPGAYPLRITNPTTAEQVTALESFTSIGDPFDSRLSAVYDAGFEVDDNDSLVTTYVRRVRSGPGGVPAIQYQHPQGVLIDIPASALPAQATGAFLLVRIVRQPGDLFEGAVLLPDYRLRGPVVDLHVFAQEPAAGGGYTVRELAAPESGTVSIAYPLTPGPLDPLVAGGFETEVDSVFASHPVTLAQFEELSAPHAIDAEARAVVQFSSLGALAVFGDGPLQDIDDSGTVDATDVQLVVKAAIGKDIGGLNADIDGDAKVNATDVQMVINGALGRW
jgi:hypothetical protein